MANVINKPYVKYRQKAFESLVAKLEKLIRKLNGSNVTLNPRVASIELYSDKLTLNYLGTLYYFRLTNTERVSQRVNEAGTIVFKLSYKDSMEINKIILKICEHANKWVKEVAQRYSFTSSKIVIYYIGGKELHFDELDSVTPTSTWGI